MVLQLRNQMLNFYRYFCYFLSPSMFLSGVPQGYVFDTLVLNILNIFSLNDTKTFHAINSNTALQHSQILNMYKDGVQLPS